MKNTNAFDADFFYAQDERNYDEPEPVRAPKKLKTLYFAYGSNLSVEQMAKRCPDAKPVKRAILNNWRLVFRGVADVEQAEGSRVHGVLWEITDLCLEALDFYEGFPTMYTRERVRVETLEGMVDATVYTMVATRGYSPPYHGYYDCIQEGYERFELPLSSLKVAVCRSLTAGDNRKRSSAISAKPAPKPVLTLEQSPAKMSNGERRAKNSKAAAKAIRRAREIDEKARKAIIAKGDGQKVRPYERPTPIYVNRNPAPRPLIEVFSAEELELLEKRGAGYFRGQCRVRYRNETPEVKRQIAEAIEYAIASRGD